MTRDYGWYRSTYADENTGVVVGPLTANPHTLIAAPSANYQVFVQRISINVGTYAAETWTFQDTADSPVKIAVDSIPAAATALRSESGSIVHDFGAEGVPLTQGKGLSLSRSAANTSGAVTVEAYRRLIGPLAMSNSN